MRKPIQRWLEINELRKFSVLQGCKLLVFSSWVISSRFLISKGINSSCPIAQEKEQGVNGAKIAAKGNPFVVGFISLI